MTRLAHVVGVQVAAICHTDLREVVIGAARPERVRQLLTLLRRNVLPLTPHTVKRQVQVDGPFPCFLRRIDGSLLDSHPDGNDVTGQQGRLGSLRHRTTRGW